MRPTNSKNSVAPLLQGTPKRQHRWVPGTLLAVFLTLAITSMATADIIKVTLRNGQQFTLYGKARVNPGGTISYRHPQYGTCYFDIKEVEIFKAPSLDRVFRKMHSSAKRAGDLESLKKVSHWALHHNRLEEFYEVIDEILEIDAKDEYALRIKTLKERMDTPIPEDPELEAELKKQVRLPDFKIARSKHFILYHDTADKPPRGERMNRADKRLQLLETVYECFLLKFYSNGVPLEIPDYRMKVLLFADYQEYLDYSTNIDPSLINASGYWSPTTNIGTFYDHSTDDQFKALGEFAEEVEENARRLKGTTAYKDLIRMAKVLELVKKVRQEANDVEVVSHEATHQLAGNTGLFPRDVRVPRWVHEGLAAYFESPDDAAWAGIGAVNEQRIEWYRYLAENQREISNVDFVVGDEVFKRASSHGAILHAYGQAWAMTHFLVERHFDELMAFYRKLGEFPPDTPMSRDVILEVFDEAFEMDRDDLNTEWRSYMRSLKTDFEKITEEE